VAAIILATPLTTLAQTSETHTQQNSTTQPTELWGPLSKGGYVYYFVQSEYWRISCIKNDDLSWQCTADQQIDQNWTPTWGLPVPAGSFCSTETAHVPIVCWDYSKVWVHSEDSDKVFDKIEYTSYLPLIIH